MYKRNYLVGKTFGTLTVISEAGRAKDRHIQYECVCECGNHKVISGNELLRGHTRSCGCKERITHGGAAHGKERLYNIWCGMRKRCGGKYYENTIVCAEWNDYARFREWAYENGYDENAAKWKCTIDRIDVNGDYEPGNCRFVDESVQMFNRHKMKSKLGVRGVYYRDSDGKYYAMITKNKKQKYLGTFDTIEDAVTARKAAELKYYGMTLEA
jgi:hypothetical protein